MEAARTPEHHGTAPATILASFGLARGDGLFSRVATMWPF